jgi:hypothetical protein
MDIEQGDVFQTKHGPIEVLSIGQFDEYVTVTDPLVHHPQDARAGTWDLEVDKLMSDIESGDVKPASLKVET